MNQMHSYKKTISKNVHSNNTNAVQQTQYTTPISYSSELSSSCIDSDSDTNNDATNNFSDSDYANYSTFYDSDNEGTSGYKYGGYHMVHIGDIYNDQYIVECKLGWGHFSTVWLATDLYAAENTNKLVALKIQKSATQYTEAAMDEIQLLSCVNQHNTDNSSNPSDHNYMVQLLNHFVITGRNGQHVVLVFSVYGPNLLYLIKLNDYKGIDINIVKKLTKHILYGLQYLHEECNIIHTDLKPENFLLIKHPPFNIHEIQSARIRHIQKRNRMKQRRIKQRELMRITQLQYDYHSVCHNKQLTKNQRKRLKQKYKKSMQLNDQELNTNITTVHMNGNSHDGNEHNQVIKIHNQIHNELISDSDIIDLHDVNDLSTNDEHTNDKYITNDNNLLSVDDLDINDINVVIADLGNGCWINKHFTDDVTTRQYRSPEVLVGYYYNEKIDVWSVACLIFELITGDYLFDPKDCDSTQSYTRDEDHLALIIELLGPLPRKLTRSGKYSHNYFNDKTGELRHIHNLDSWNLCDVLHEKYKLSINESTMLSDFLAPMLHTDPDERCSARVALRHPWLYNDSDEYMNRSINPPIDNESVNDIHSIDGGSDDSVLKDEHTVSHEYNDVNDENENDEIDTNNLNFDEFLHSDTGNGQTIFQQFSQMFTNPQALINKYGHTTVNDNDQHDDIDSSNYNEMDGEQFLHQLQQRLHHTQLHGDYTDLPVGVSLNELDQYIQHQHLQSLQHDTQDIDNDAHQ